MRDRDSIILETIYTKNVLNEARIDTSNFMRQKFLGGSTGAYLYLDKHTGEHWVVKKGANVQHMYNEYLSNKIYSKYGLNTPESYIGQIDGEEVLVTKYLKDSVPLRTAIDSGRHLNIANEVGKGILLDIILANWDVVGTNHDMDNVRVTPDGTVWRVDTGGSTIYRAQGKEKGNAFGDMPSEHNTFRDKNSGTYASEIFSKITNDEISQKIKEEAKRYIINGDQVSHVRFLRDLRSAIYGDSDLNLSEENKQKVYRTLAKRVFNLYRIFSK